MKRYILIFIVILNLIGNCSVLKANTDERIIDDIKYIKSKTNFDLSFINNFQIIKKMYEIQLGKWAPMRKIVLRDEDYPSKHKMIEIKNTPKVAFSLDLNNNLTCLLMLGKFKSYDDSYLAFIDSVPSSRPWKKSLFSGDTLENATVITIKKDFNIAAEAYLFYKNCLCCFLVGTYNKEISEKDYLIIDELIKNMRILIDKSF